MKLTSIICEGPRASRRGYQRLSDRPGGRKPISAALAAALTLAAATVAASPPATPLGDVWHVGPSPAVHALCHTGNLLWVGTTAGLYLIDIRSAKIVTQEVPGERLPPTSVRAIVAKGDSVFVGTDAGLSLFRRNDDGNIS